MIAALLALLLLCATLIGCAKSEKDEEETTKKDKTVSTDNSNDDKYKFPDIELIDHGGIDFTIVYPAWSLYEKYYLAEETNGEAINDVNYERQLAINEHLGINILGLPLLAEGGKDAVHVLAEKVQTAVNSGEDSYQLALTHCFVGVLGLGLGGHLADFGEAPNVNLDADYWRGESMESIAINGKKFYGTGSFILYEPAVILFNKDMISEFPDFNVDNLYQNVRDKVWTIELMKMYASSVSTDANENVSAGNGVYGFSCQMDWELCGFMAASNYFTASKETDGSFKLTPFSQKVDDLYIAVKDLMDAEYTYSWNYSATSEEIGMKVMKEGRTMFYASGISPCINTIANSDVKIGILPYPSTEVGQEITTLDWAGFMTIPSSVKDFALSGAVSELLCYYGDMMTYPAFYDKLLGQRTAENMQDAEMLDIIFDSLVTDPGLTFIKDGGDLYQMFYMFPQLISKGSVEVSSHFARYLPSAQSELDF